MRNAMEASETEGEIGDEDEDGNEEEKQTWEVD
jgi:hypothetical protein